MGKYCWIELVTIPLLRARRWAPLQSWDEENDNVSRGALFRVRYRSCKGMDQHVEIVIAGVAKSGHNATQGVSIWILHRLLLCQHVAREMASLRSAE